MKTMTEELKGFVEGNVKLIVDHPLDIKVDVNISTKAVIINIKTNEKDIGKLIGKYGRTIESLKTLSLAVKNTKFPHDQRKVMIEVLEEENSDYRDKFSKI